MPDLIGWFRLNDPALRSYTIEKNVAVKLPCQRRAADAAQAFGGSFSSVNYEEVSMTDFMKIARERGLMPDWAWYQLNGKSAQENWREQRVDILDALTAEDDTPQIAVASEVKVK